MPKPNSEKNMQERHSILSRALNELVSCFTLETGQLPAETLMADFQAWAEDMRNTPTCVGKHDDQSPYVPRRRNVTEIADALGVPPPSRV